MDSVLFVGPLDRVLLLRTLPILEGLAPVHLAAIAQHAHERLFERHALLRTPDETAGAIYLIAEGEVDVRGDDGGMRKLGPGDAVGFVEMLSRAHRNLEARALVETVALELDWDAQLAVCEEYFPIVMQYIGYLAKRTVETLEQRPSAAQARARKSGARRGKPKLDLVERILVLSRARAFSTSSLDALAELAHHVADVHWRAGDQLWASDDPAAYFLLLTSGSVECTTRSGGRFALYADNDVGMHEALLQDRRWHTAVSTARTTALRIDIEPFMDILEDHFDLALDFMAMLAGDLIELQKGGSGNGPEERRSPVR